MEYLAPLFSLFSLHTSSKMCDSSLHFSWPFFLACLFGILQIKSKPLRDTTYSRTHLKQYLLLCLSLHREFIQENPIVFDFEWQMAHSSISFDFSLLYKGTTQFWQLNSLYLKSTIVLTIIKCSFFLSNYPGLFELDLYDDLSLCNCNSFSLSSFLLAIKPFDESGSL